MGDMILQDNFEETLTPLLRFKPAFALRTGIYSDIERLSGEKMAGVSTGREKFIKDYFEEKGRAIPEIKSADNQELKPAELLKNAGKNIEKDIELLNKEEFTGSPKTHIQGEQNLVYFHKKSRISPLAEINTEDGPVVVDEGCEISSFSILKGPLYIGKNSILDKVMISSSIAGNTCRLGGEISDSIIGNFTNKHHEGFLGHSIVGDWVNLGALTTTSDLKNNYGNIRLEFQGKDYNTNEIKFGSIIGDGVKTAIGTLLNTGTIIDIGALLFEGHKIKKYFGPFFWGGEKEEKYEIEKFLSDMEKIMARRKEKMTYFFKNQSRETYQNHG